MITRMFWRLVFIASLLLCSTTVAKADSGFTTSSNGNTLDQSFTLTPEELLRKAEKEKGFRHFMLVGVNPNATTSKWLNVGAAETYRQPEGTAYRNYCGPAATQVAIRARTSSVPGLSTVGAGEYIDPNSGVTATNIKAYINSYLNTTFYIVGSSPDESYFGYLIQEDIYTGYVVITGAKTNGMPGWGSTSVNHFVAAYAYDYSNSTNKRAYYVDTGSEYAGHHYSSGGNYFNNVKLSDFFSWVQRFNYQVW